MNIMIHNNYKSTVTADADASEVGTVLRVCTLTFSVHIADRNEPCINPVRALHMHCCIWTDHQTTEMQSKQPCSRLQRKSLVPACPLFMTTPPARKWAGSATRDPSGLNLFLLLPCGRRHRTLHAKTARLQINSFLAGRHSDEQS